MLLVGFPDGLAGRFLGLCDLTWLSLAVAGLQEFRQISGHETECIGYREELALLGFPRGDGSQGIGVWVSPGGC